MSKETDAPGGADSRRNGIGRRQLIQGSAALGASVTLPRYAFSQSEKKSPLAGKSIHMQILGIAGWLPSKLGVDMSPDFAKYAKAKYGYDVSFSFADAPFGTLFQKAATSLATRSQEYNIIISDSQWLGALATPGWIVQLNDIIAKNPELNIEWWSPSIRTQLPGVPGRQQQALGLSPGRRHHRHVRPQGHPGGAGRGGGVQGQIRPQSAHDMGGLREDGF